MYARNLVQKLENWENWEGFQTALVGEADPELEHTGEQEFEYENPVYQASLRIEARKKGEAYELEGGLAQPLDIYIAEEEPPHSEFVQQLLTGYEDIIQEHGMDGFEATGQPIRVMDFRVELSDLDDVDRFLSSIDTVSEEIHELHEGYRL
ncbi:MAG: hypothetical protein ABEI58_00935 [Candidatus Nanohaloarchaea archaeon]